MLYHTARSHVLFRILFKGNSNKIFYPFILHISCLPWPLSIGLKHLRFCNDFSESFEFFEIDSAQYDTARSQVPRSIILLEQKLI